MNNQPLTLKERMAEKFRLATPLIRIGDTVGLARDFYFESATIVIVFEWVIIKGVVMHEYIKKMLIPSIKADGDTLVLHSDGCDVEITNLLAEKFKATVEKQKLASQK